MNTRIHGVILAALTPRLSAGVGVDSAAALDLMDFLESHGVDGVTLFGSTGEFPHFDLEDRARLVGLISKRSRVPVLVNASHSTLEGAVTLARAAADAGAAAVLIMPPYYFRYDPETLRAFFLEFAAHVDIPGYLYNIPQFTSDLPIWDAIDLLATGNFAGIKDSSGSWGNFEALQRAAAADGFSVFVGSDRLYSRACAAGGAGAISGVATVLPELIVAIDRRARSGRSTIDLDRYAGEFLDRTLPFPFPVGIREALAVRGLKTGPHATPLSLTGARELEEFRGWFREWLPVIERTCSLVPDHEIEVAGKGD